MPSRQHPLSSKTHPGVSLGGQDLFAVFVPEKDDHAGRNVGFMIFVEIVPKEGTCGGVEKRNSSEDFLMVLSGMVKLCVF